MKIEYREEIDMGIGFLSQSQKSGLKLKLDKNEPIKKDDKWDVTITLLVKTADNVPQEDITIIIFHNRQEAGEEETDDNGYAEKTFDGLGKGNHVFEAQIKGTGTRRKITVTLKDDKPQKPPFRVLACPPIRVQNKITQHFQALAEDNSPVKGAIIRLVNSESGFTVELPETDKRGCVGIELTWEPEEKCKMLHIQILGTSITDFVNIYK